MPRTARSRWFFPAAACLLAAASAGPAASAQSVLFVRGADRSGGFLEENTDAGRTEQLADITNTSTEPGNHGWFELAEALRADGFTVTQIEEGVEAGNTSGPTEGVAVDFGGAVTLDAYDVVVMGSNNARYSEAQVDAFESYVRGGGGAIFISDANFGSDWADASDSDQPFLSRFGLTVNQDNGTYPLDALRRRLRRPRPPAARGRERLRRRGRDADHRQRRRHHGRGRRGHPRRRRRTRFAATRGPSATGIRGPPPPPPPRTPRCSPPRPAPAASSGSSTATPSSTRTAPAPTSTASTTSGSRSTSSATPPCPSRPPPACCSRA